MTTNLYFVRHAHSTYTPDEYGRPLSEQGVLDANKVTELLKTENMDLNFGRNSKCLTFINYHSMVKSSYMLREYGSNPNDVVQKTRRNKDKFLNLYKSTELLLIH